MRSRESERAQYRKQAIRCQAQLSVGKCRADDEQQHAGSACRNDEPALVSAKTDRKCENAERQNDDEHLQMQVSGGKLREKRQACDEQRQCQTMNQAQAGQGDRGTV